MTTARNLLQRLPLRQDLCLIALIIVTLAMMVLPMPAEAADVLIAISIALAVLLLMSAVYLVSPADFYTFPSVILLTTIFRLSISITTSRLVLTQADAGEIIHTFGEFVISGNVVVGLVVFLIISVVQFVVVTKGAERVAEVAARFALDSMPGKQMSIDNDARAGNIKADEAKRRRGALQRESQLFGAMDGAMKFVKGDAIASLLIIAVNLIGGITIGCAQRGMSLGQAGSTYSLLAIGDGLIAQIPALLISLAAGLVVTRVAADDAANLGVDIAKQIASDPRVLFVAAAIVLAMGLIPGFPTVVFMVLAALFGGGGWIMRRQRLGQKEASTASPAVSDDPARQVVLVRLGRDLIAERTRIEATLAKTRTAMNEELGITIPDITVIEAEAEDAAGLCVEMNRIPLLSIPMRANESWSDAPVEGAELRIGPGGRKWSVIEGSTVDQPGALNPVDVAGLFVRHLLSRKMGQLVGIQETQSLISQTERSYGDLVREAMRSVREQVSSYVAKTQRTLAIATNKESQLLQMQPSDPCIFRLHAVMARSTIDENDLEIATRL